MLRRCSIDCAAPSTMAPFRLTCPSKVDPSIARLEPIFADPRSSTPLKVAPSRSKAEPPAVVPYRLTSSSKVESRPFYQERKLLPRRFDNVSRFMLVLYSHAGPARPEKSLPESSCELLLRTSHWDPTARVAGLFDPTEPIASASDREGMGFLLQHVTTPYVAGPRNPESPGSPSVPITTDASSGRWRPAGRRTPGAQWAA